MVSAVGVDVGGTFTDVVAFDGERLVGGKVPTTADQADGVIQALEAVGAGDRATFLHGTTAGTNALLEGSGARAALVTTRGYEDLVEIGRQARPSLYDPFHDRAAPLASPALRFGYQGDVETLLADLEASAPESIAVALVRSYADPTDELALADRIGERLGVPVSVGAVVSPGFREYERIATTLLDAYLTPQVSGYLRRLSGRLATESRLVMTSAGGLLPFETAAGLVGRLVLSGPAAGVVAAAELVRAKGHHNAIGFDMGGTSTDVCRITAGRATVVAGRKVAGRVNRVPSLPINTIGAGGGSVGWRDTGGALRVGPRSAGASPGPACYLRGGVEATVTDANLYLGNLPPALALGGSVVVDRDAAERALGHLGSQVGLDAETTARGVIEIVDAHMERAIRSVSIEEGVDPRDGALVAFGGAGGLHATRLAGRLGIRTVLVPMLSGVFSALGLLLAQPRADVTSTVLLEEGSERLPAVIARLATEADEAYTRMGAPSGSKPMVTAEVRYLGQAHELSVEAATEWATLRASFETAHRSRFGFDLPADPVELVDLRATVIGPAPMSWSDLPPIPRSAIPVPEEIAGNRVWQRGLLPADFEIAGPGLVVERDSVTLLEPADRLVVHDDGTLEITVS